MAIKMLTLVAAAFFIPLPRLALAAETTAVCGSTFSWMNNDEGQNPCLVVAYLTQACQGGNYEVVALPQGLEYSSPTYDPKYMQNTANNTANFCTCSWAAFNLYSACSLCQGGPAFIWTPWSTNCTNYELNSTYFPPDTPFSTNTSIPFWAGNNPTNWTGGQFDTVQAQALANEHQPDFTSGENVQTTSSASSGGHSNVGAIAGGVVGGVVVIFLIIFGILFVRYREKRKLAAVQSSAEAPLQRPAMAQSSIYSSQNYFTNGGSVSPYSGLTPQTPPILSTPTPPGHSITPLSNFSAAGDSIYQVTPLILPPTSPEPAADRSSITYTHDRKVSKDSMNTIATTAYTHDRKVSKDSTKPAARWNPPPYSPSFDGQSAAGESSASGSSTRQNTLHVPGVTRPTSTGDSLSELLETEQDGSEDAPPTFHSLRLANPPANEGGGSGAQQYPREKQ